MQKYKDEYSKQYSCIVQSYKSDENAFYTVLPYSPLFISFVSFF